MKPKSKTTIHQAGKMLNEYDRLPPQEMKNEYQRRAAVLESMKKIKK